MANEVMHTGNAIRAKILAMPTLTVKHTAKMHGRFLIIDGSVLYHVGASLKDLGKKCFAFEILDSALIPLILQNV